MAGGNDIEVTGPGVTEEPIRGRDSTAGAGKEKKRRDRSKAPAETPTAEQIVDEIASRFEKVEFNFKTLESHVLDEIESVKGNVQEGLGACTATEDRLDRLEALVRDLQGSIEGMHEDIAVCKRAIASGGASTSTSSPKVECPRPNGYDGVRDAKEIDNFLWRMQQYFEGIGLTDEATKVRTATLYLSDTAMLWWRRKHGDIERGTCRIDTWGDFVRELKRQFYPENVVYEARKQLRELKQEGTIREYVKEFTTLMLQIPNMSEDDLLFFFVDGLQHWAKQELQRRGVKTVDEAIAAAESLIEFRPQPSSDAIKKTERYPARGGGETRDQENRDPRDQRRAPAKEGDRGAGRRSYEERKQAFVPKGGCFVCKGPHAMKDCPKLGSLSAIMNRQEAEDKEEEPSVIGSLQVLNALKAKPVRATSSKGLMYVEAHINGTPTKALVDTGASHNFITREEATRLGLSWSEGDGWVKTVNANARRLEGVVRNANLQLGTWKGHVNFSIAPMDDFKVVIGMDFLRQVTAIPMPSFNAVCILEKGSPCMVPTVEGDGAVNKQLSATQVAKGAKRGELTYLAVLKKEDGRDKSLDVPPIIRRDPKGDRDVVPTESPTKMPSRREEDHAIERKSGAKPPKIEGIAAKSKAKEEILASIERGLKRDLMAKELPKPATEGKTKRFWVEDGLPYAKGRRPDIPKWDNLRKDGKCPGTEKLAKSWEERADLARACLKRARRKVKKWADGTRRPQEFSVGDQVLVKLLPQQFKTFRSLHKGLVRKYEGPFPITGKVGRVSYRVDLPPTMKIHSVFHVSMLKPYKGDVEDPSRGHSCRAPPTTTKSYDKEVEEVLANDVIRRRGVPPKRRYLIKWKGLPESEASWELEEDLWQFRDVIEAHEATRASPV